jgi:hydrogenase maturation factor HypF (carbamoyltransferase family)
MNAYSFIGKKMAYILELQTDSKQNYLTNIVVAASRKYGINTEVEKLNEKILFRFDSEHENLQDLLDTITKTLPASLFLKSSNSYLNDAKVITSSQLQNNYPISLGLCPSCQQEMLDVSSKRYYYPFTSCVACGANHSFLTSYPYLRKNTSFKFLVPCESYSQQIQNPGLKESHHINSCHDCGVAVRLVSKSSERYANDAGSFRTMFEVAAKALNDNKKLLMKTTMGYRIFYKTKEMNNNSILMMINASKITDHLSLITEEFNTLLSIERPRLNVTLKNEDLKEQLGANTAYVKYPDDGFSILLGVELQKLGIDFIAYEDTDSSHDADILMDYDLEITPQQDIRVFLNKDVQFIAEGERVSFPCEAFTKRSLVSIAHEFAGVPKDETMFFDKMEYIDSVKVEMVKVLEGEDESYHKKQYPFMQDEASFMSVIAEHSVFDKKCVGAYFDEEPSFLYYDGKSVLRIVPPKYFDGSKILEDIKNLREGSDRLIDNLQKSKPHIYKKLEAVQSKKDVKLFEAVAILLDLEDESMRGVTKEAMKFVGKGGIQIDTHVKDNRFDHAAFLASIVSYQLAGVSKTILAYSIFESFGDYFNDIVQELKAKTKAEEIILCGSDFANQSLFSRMQRNLKMSPPLMNINYPIGKENAVVGGVFL